MKRQSEIVLMKGKPADISYADALARMNAKDIVFKGANMVNYAKRQAAVCVGAPDGGTVAKLRKYTDEGKGRWIAPEDDYNCSNYNLGKADDDWTE